MASKFTWVVQRVNGGPCEGEYNVFSCHYDKDAFQKYFGGGCKFMARTLREAKQGIKREVKDHPFSSPAADAIMYI